jgi:hypothetical protein
MIRVGDHIEDFEFEFYQDRDIKKAVRLGTVGKILGWKRIEKYLS